MIKNKEQLLSLLESFILDIREKLNVELKNAIYVETDLQNKVNGTHGNSQELYSKQLHYASRRTEELNTLSISPFFAKVIYGLNGEKKEIYISKYELADSNIVSWTAPVAELRFEDLGLSKIHLPDKKISEINLKQKDNYVINQEKVIYYSQESEHSGVEIIYEDFFANLKTEFGLSEIISKIEKEQYKIIQSEPAVPLIISGPAGSGKTTICLHRVAYLLQRPETSNMYASQNMLMLVQDKSTKSYFSSILPKLGINNMYVETYFEWVMYVLNISGIKEVEMYEMDESYYNFLQSKVEIIDSKLINKKKYSNDILDELDSLYKKNLNKENYNMYVRNKDNHVYDYLDATIMMYMSTNDAGDIGTEHEYHKVTSNGNFKKVMRFNEIKYGMVIVDEYQNYSNDQIDIIKKVVNSENKSIVYIGDINQKSVLKVNSKINNYTYFDCKKIELNKVYRNTKNILEFIKSKGYKIEVPDDARSGIEVEIFRIENSIEGEELIIKIKSILETVSREETVGILCDSLKTKNLINKMYTEEIYLTQDNIKNNVKILTKIESQGTEFNTVISIDESSEYGVAGGDMFKLKQKLTKKNIDYIGYTRAVERLMVVDVV